MTQFFKWNMFFTSFLPLWISIVVTDLWTIGNKIVENSKEAFENSKIEIITIVLLIGYTLFSMVYISRIISVQEKSTNKEQGIIVRAKRANKLSAEFLLAYILPMIAFDFSSMNNIVLFLIYFVVLSFLCIRNSNVYTNIFLELKGYKMYECDIERRVMNRTITDEACLVISKNSLIQAIPRILQDFDFENYIYIDIGGDTNE